MKTLVVNREKFPASFISCKNLGQLVQWVESVGEKEKQFIVKMELNGKVIDVEEEKLLDNLTIDEVEELTVTLCPVNELVGDTMSSVIGIIQDLQLKCIDYAKNFRKQNKMIEDEMHTILYKNRLIIDSLEEIFMVHINKKFTLKHYSLWKEAERELTNILQCILQSMELDDANFLADIIEYDLTHALSQWEEVLEMEILDNTSISNIFNLKTKDQAGDNGVDA